MKTKITNSQPNVDGRLVHTWKLDKNIFVWPDSPCFACEQHYITPLFPPVSPCCARDPPSSPAPVSLFTWQQPIRLKHFFPTGDLLPSQHSLLTNRSSIWLFSWLLVSFLIIFIVIIGYTHFCTVVSGYFKLRRCFCLGWGGITPYRADTLAFGALTFSGNC